MPVISSSDLNLLRTAVHRNRIFASVLRPATLWAARVNNGAITREATTIAFDGGSGTSFGTIEALQEVWVGTTAGGNEIGRARIRSITSGDGGVTGTLVVAANALVWADNAYLTFKHDYPLKPRFPYIDPDTELFYKDRDIAYTDENEEPPPVVVAGPHRAGFVVGSDIVFYVDASASYAVADGTTISSYALSVAPSSGVTVSFSSTTGVGSITITNPGIYWAKFTVTDSNGKSQISYRALFAHSTNPTNANYPFVDFTVGNGLTGDWERGGWNAGINVYNDADLEDIPDGTLMVIWQTLAYDDTAAEPEPPMVGVLDTDHITFWNPFLQYGTMTGGPAAFDIPLTFTTRVYINGEVAGAGVNIDIHFAATGGTGGAVTGTTDAAGYLSVDGTVEDAADPGTAVARYETVLGTTLASVAYEDGEPSPTPPTPIISHAQAGIRNLLVGYVRKERLARDMERGVPTADFTLETIEAVLRLYNFSVQLDAVASPATWPQYPATLTAGRTLHHLWRWHSTLLEIADVVGLLDNTDLRPAALFEEGNLYTMADNVARLRGIRAHVVCDKNGRVHLTPDAQLLPDSDRAALVTAAEITEEDRSGELTILREPINRVAFVKVSGFSWDGTFADDLPDVEPLCASSPGTIPADAGESLLHFDRQTFASQAHANQIAGRVYAQVNNLYPEGRTAMPGNYIGVLEPALAEWWEINVASGETVRGIVLADQKMVLRNVQVAIDVARGAIHPSAAVFELEMETPDGVAGWCMDTIPELGGGDPPIPGASALPGAIVTASSVYYLPPNTTAWTLRTAESTRTLIADPFWRARQGSHASANAILLRGGAGYLKRSTNAGSTWSDVTPADDPPNTAGDSPAPAVEDITFEVLAPSWTNQGEFVVIATWQNGDDEWRSWLYHTDDDYATGTWGDGLTGGGGSTPDYGPTAAFNTDFVQFDTPVGGFSYRNSLKNVAKLTASKFVIAWVELDGSSIQQSIKAVCATVSGGVISYGTTVEVYAIPEDYVVYRLKVVGIHEQAFLIGWVEETDLGVQTGYLTTGNVLSGTIITIQTVQDFNANAPVNWNIARVNDDLAILVYNDNDDGKGYYSFVGVPDVGPPTIESPSTFVSSGPEPQAIDVCALTETKIVIVYLQQDGSDRNLNCVAVDGSVGTPVEIITTTNISGFLDVAIDYLTSSKFVVAFRDAADGGKGKAVIGDVSSLTISLGTVTTYEGAGISSPVANVLTRLSAGRFVTSYAHSSTGYTRINSVSGTTITVGSENTDPDTATNEPASYSVVALSSSRFVVAYSEQASEGRDGQAFVVDLEGYEARGLSLAIDKVAGDLLWVTLWNGSGLVVRVFDLPGLTAVRETELGAASEDDVDDLVYVLYAYVPFGAAETCYIFGRVELGHIFVSDDAGVSYELLEDGWGTNHCGALLSHANGRLIAIRNYPSQSKLYSGLAGALTLRSTLPFPAGVNQQALDYDYSDGTVAAAARAANAIMVALSVSPYLTWADITANHGTAAGVRSLVIL